MPRTLASNRNLVDATFFVPNTVPGCLLWLKADAITSLNDGDPIPSWTDSSGNGYNAAGSGGTSPAYRTNVLNGLPVVRFSGSNGFQLGTAGTAETAFRIPRYTVFFVAIQVSGTTIIAKNTTGTGAGGRRKLQVSVGGSLGLSAGFDGQNISQAMTTTNWNIGGVIAKANNNHDFIVNGTLTNNTTTVDDSTMNNTQLEVGQAFGNGSERLTGDIAEIIIYNRDLSTSDWHGVHNYLSLKYALGSTVSVGARTLATGRTLAVGRTLAA